MGVFTLNSAAASSEIEEFHKRQKACEATGSVDDCYNLADMYYSGIGVVQNHAEAVQIFQNLCYATDGNTGCEIAGRMHENGENIPKDYVKSYVFYHIAMASGSIDGAHGMDSIAQKMTSEQIIAAENLLIRMLKKRI